MAEEEEAVEEEVQEEAVEEEYEQESESGEELPEGVEEEDASSWRDLIQDEKLSKHAERFTDLDSLVKANMDSRVKLSKAVVTPGKDDDEESWNAYRTALGVPQDVDGYDFPLPEGPTIAKDFPSSNSKFMSSRITKGEFPDNTSFLRFVVFSIISIKPLLIRCVSIV